MNCTRDVFAPLRTIFAFGALLLASSVLSGRPIRANAWPLAPVPATASAVEKGQARPPDAWQFPDDEEQTETWREVLVAQAWDIGGFAAVVAFALVSFFRKSPSLKLVALGATLVYLGLVKSQLISIVNLFAVLDWNLPLVRYNLSWYLLAIFTVLSTVLWGRLYCGRLCAFGALTQLMDRVVPARWRRDLPPRVERQAVKVKYVVLAAAVAYFLVTRDRSIYRYIEPFWMFGFHAPPVLWGGLGLLLAATVFVRNLYCRYLCPVGAALGVLSNLTVFRIKRWSECKTCKICEKACEWGAIKGPKIIASECVRCDDCERLYNDRQKCPHWIIIRKRSDFAVASAGSADPATP
jgi:polyferredoxin